MNEFKYTINDIFKFPVGTKFKDQEGNNYKIYQDKEHYSKTLKYTIVTQKLLHSKFKIIN
jgi:hypothetical protein